MWNSFKLRFRMKRPFSLDFKETKIIPLIFIDYFQNSIKISIIRNYGDTKKRENISENHNKIILEYFRLDFVHWSNLNWLNKLLECLNLKKRKIRKKERKIKRKNKRMKERKRKIERIKKQRERNKVNKKKKRKRGRKKGFEWKCRGNNL